MSMSDKVHTTANGEIALWAVPGCSVMLKIISKSPDPIELAEGEVEELITILTELNVAVKGKPE